LKIPFSKKYNTSSGGHFVGPPKPVVKSASPGFSNQIDKGSMTYTTGKNESYSNPVFEAKKAQNEAQAELINQRTASLVSRRLQNESRAKASNSGGSRGSMIGKVGPVLKGGLNIGPQSGAFAAVNPFAQLNQSIYFGFTQMGMVFLFLIGWFVIGKYGGYTYKGSVGAFASTPLFYILMVEVVNMVFNFFYLMTSGTFRIAERFGNVFVLLMMLSGVAVVPIFVGFTTTYLALSGVLVLLAWVYIVCPGNPVFNIPFGFLSIYLVSVLLCMVGGIHFNFSLGFEPVVPLFQQIFNAIMGVIR
jgi:hypothetical protein